MFTSSSGTFDPQTRVFVVVERRHPDRGRHGRGARGARLNMVLNAQLYLVVSLAFPQDFITSLCGPGPSSKEPMIPLLGRVDHVFEPEGA